jgi:hypothetical protein
MSQQELKAFHGKFWKIYKDLSGFVRMRQDAKSLILMVRKKRLELLRLAALEPKSSASTNSATLAGSFLPHVKLPMPQSAYCILILLI